MKSLYYPVCANYLLAGSGEFIDCLCGWNQPDELKAYSEKFWLDYGYMTFSDWFSNHKELGWDDDSEYPPTPTLYLGEDKLEEVLAELERLGFSRGNDFSKQFECSYIEIWYGDFYNVFRYGGCITEIGRVVFTLEDLKAIEL